MTEKVIKLNIFPENICENEPYKSFCHSEQTEESQITMREITDDLQKMTSYFLSKTDWVEKSCLSCLDEEDVNTVSFDIVFCENDKIHEINRDYRNIDRPTDVISFALFADSEPEERFIFDGEINLGEIIISLEKTMTQAKDNGQTFKDELYFLLAHGILHLAGYDHQSEETLEEMWDMQKEMVGKV